MPQDRSAAPPDDRDTDLHRLAMLGRLIPGIAHEVNTLLGVIGTAASHLSRLRRDLHERFDADGLTRTGLGRYLDDARRAEDIILINLDRASDLVSSIKHVSVAHNHTDQQHLNVHRFLEEVTRSARGLLHDCPHQLHIGCPDDLVVETLPGALASILLNLLANTARHAQPEHLPSAQDPRSIMITLTAGPTAEGGWTLVYSDDGKGIPPALRSTAFEPYVTSCRDNGGSGLGLAIVHDLTTGRLAGSVRLSSQPGQGTTFHFTFPRALPGRVPPFGRVP